MHSNVMLMIRCTTRSPVNTLIRSFDRYQKLNFYSFADLFKGFPVIDSIIFQNNPNEVGQRFSKIFLFGYRSFFLVKIRWHLSYECNLRHEFVVESFMKNNNRMFCQIESDRIQYQKPITQKPYVFYKRCLFLSFSPFFFFITLLKLIERNYVERV